MGIFWMDYDANDNIYEPVSREYVQTLMNQKTRIYFGPPLSMLTEKEKNTLE